MSRFGDVFCQMWVSFWLVFLACSVRRRRCSFAVFVCSVLGRFSSCRSSLFVVRGKGGHAEHTVKPMEFHDFSKLVKAAALRKEGRP